jgi:glycosyltransferase involved in cell wall biosynthesis
MTQASVDCREHLLLYEPRTEGHHLGWLRFITEDLLSARLQLTLAVDLRPEKVTKVRDQLGELVSAVTLINAYDAAGRHHGDGNAGSVAYCLRQSGADRVFLCALDEIASACWRRATFGILPPVELRGRMGGIYHRPRFMAAPVWSPNRWLKQIGFRRLMQQKWFRQLLFVDEYLAHDLQTLFHGAPIFFLPDPCPPGYDSDPIAARNKLQIPCDRKILLFYGTGARRKGLHLAIEAMLQLPPESPAFLLCAGQQNPSGKTAAGLAQLVRQNRAHLLDRYVTVEEEKMCFAASDAVLLPYLNHFGTSGVLSRAMSVAKPVITSDEQLLGRLTREHRLGLVFPSGNIPALRDCISQIAQLSATGVAPFAAAARDYAKTFSREAFRALLKSFAPGPRI